MSQRFDRIVQCQINAGLGNQLFQACAAVSYGLRFQRNVVLDGSWYKLQRYLPQRRFLLESLLTFGGGNVGASSFRLQYQRKSIEGILAVTLRKRKRLRELLPQILDRRFIFEKDMHARAGEMYSDYPERRLIMLGSWQTADHFEYAGSRFCEMVRPQFELSDDWQRWVSMIRGTAAPVSVHVRRGDFLSIGHGVHTPSYYRAAAEAIRSRLGAEPDWFVFSEDQDWCRSNLDFLGERVRFVSVKCAHTEIEELLLMKECRAGAIIANSSFSWWGAALGNAPCRPVIASKYRHGIGEGDVQGERLLPHWEMVEEF